MTDINKDPRRDSGERIGVQEPVFDPQRATTQAPNALNAASAPYSAAPGWEREALQTIAQATLASVKEQRAARRWKIFFRLIWLIVVICVLAGIFRLVSSGPAASGGRHTALIELHGAIAAESDASSENINTALDNAFDDADTAGVILQINSPGGSPVEAGIIYRHILQLRAAHPKIPVYAVIGDVGASGAYYVAAAATKIYVDPASIVGSIGVIMENFGFTGLMDKLGVERRVQIAGENKSIGDPFSPETDAQKQRIQQMLDEIHGQFIAAVRKGRGDRLHETPDMFSGAFWTGEDSIKMGLADGLGDTRSVARDVIKVQNLEDFSVKDSLTDRVARRFGTMLGAGAVGAVLNHGVQLR